MKYFLLFFVLLSQFLKAEESQFEVHIVPSSNQIFIKDILEVSMDLTFPADYRVDVETLRQNILHSSSFYEHPFAIVDMKVGVPKKLVDNRMLQHILIYLQPLRLGDVNLTFYNISFNPINKEQKIQHVVSPILPIHIETVGAPTQFSGRLAPLLTFSKTLPLHLDEKNLVRLTEDLLLREKEQTLNVKQMHIKQIPWIQIGSLLLVLFVFWMFLKYPPGKPALSPDEKAEMARKEALQNLEKLKEKKLPEKGFFDEYYVELTQPIRIYVESKYRVPASTSTTPEFLREVSKNPSFPSETRKQLGEFLQQADKVKFGTYRPSLEECDKAQELAIQFIKSDLLVN